jgi:hypothetical protein
LAGKTTTLRQKKGKVDVLMGLDNSRWLPRQANNEGKSPGNFRLMKSKFGELYMIMGSDAEMRKLEKNEHPAHDALERVRKGGSTHPIVDDWPLARSLPHCPVACEVHASAP